MACILCLKHGNATNRDFDSAFLCPPCFIAQHGPLVPYRVSYITYSDSLFKWRQGFLGRTKRPLEIKAVFGHRSTLRRTYAQPTLVVDILLAHPGNLPNPTALMAYQHLESLMPGYVGYAKLPFDWTNAEGSEAYQFAIGKLSSLLSEGGELSL